MKHLKMLGLAAIAALGLMAFVGAGTASATTLATDAAGTIHYEVGTVIHATLKEGTSAKLESGSTTIATCTKSTVQGAIEDPVVETEIEGKKKKFPSGTWITGAISKLTWEGCSQTTDNVSLGSLEIMKTGSDEGEVVGKGSQVTLTAFSTSCTYGTGEGTKLGTIKGGEAPEMVISAELPKTAGSFLCPSVGRWTATYVVTSPHAVHIVE
jgi:hypothetical protein